MTAPTQQLTLRERERLAYIEGRLEEAKLLAALIDAEHGSYSPFDVA